MAKETSKTERTKTIRIDIDFELAEAKNAEELRTFARLVIATLHNNLAGITGLQWTQIIPVEPDFAWHDAEGAADES